MRLNPQIALVALLVLASTAGGDPPVWWSEGNPPVIRLSAGGDNRSPANIGQAKWMAKSALEVMRSVHPLVAQSIESELVGSGKPIPHWNPPSNQSERDLNHAPLLVGQLKAISAPFYEALHTVEAEWLETQLIANQTKDSQNPSHPYPWTAASSDDKNKAIASIGQLKAVFSLRFEELDTDHDGLADSWERLHFLNLRFDGDADTDNDGLTHHQEFSMGTNPNAVGADADSNGLPDDWEQANAGRLAVHPPVLSASLLPGDDASRPLLVSNDSDETISLLVSVARNIAPTFPQDDYFTAAVPYAWQDISSTGTLLATISDSDDASEPVSLPFSFPFYGNLITDIHVCSNGFLSSEARSDVTGPPLPNSGAPPNLISPLWMDLNPASGGDIFYQSFGDRFIVQFQDVASYGNPGETYTFQTVLFSNGEIQFRYAAVNGLVEDATIGIQNAAGDQAASVTPGAYNPAAGRAIRIRFSNPEFFAMNPVTAILPPHSITILNGDFHSHLPAGQYDASITLTPTSETITPLQASAVLKVLADNDFDGMPDVRKQQTTDAASLSEKKHLPMM